MEDGDKEEKKMGRREARKKLSKIVEKIEQIIGVQDERRKMR